MNKEKRASWQLNGKVGWYVGPSMNHYRCLKCFFPKTRQEQDCNTVEFFPHAVQFPRVTVKDHLTQAADDIVTILTQPPSTTVPSLKAGDPIRNALLQLENLLKQAAPIKPVMSSNHIPKSPNVVPCIEEEIVQPSNTNDIGTVILQNYSNLPKNIQFQNTGTYN